MNSSAEVATLTPPAAASLAPPASRHRGAIAVDRETVKTWANLVTLVRTVCGLIAFSIAAYLGDYTWNLIGLAIYWIMDIGDGLLARTLNQETRLGAQLDIVADRLLVTFFYFNHLGTHPELLLPVVLFLVQFAGIDLFLSIQFLRWPVASPNYFYLVDRRIWWLSWSMWGKASNSGLVTLLLLSTGWVWVPACLCAALIGVKIYSCVRIYRLPAPERAW